MVCLGGYHSYEVPHAKVRDLMEQWQARLGRAADISFGPVVRIDMNPATNDWEVFTATPADGAAPVT